MLKFRLPKTAPDPLPPTVTTYVTMIDRPGELIARISSGLDPFSSDFRKQFTERLDDELRPAVQEIILHCRKVYAGIDEAMQLRYACAIGAGLSPGHAVLLHAVLKGNAPHIADSLAKTALKEEKNRANPLARFLFDRSTPAPYGEGIGSDETGTAMALLSSVRGGEFSTNIFADVASELLFSRNPNVMNAVCRRFEAFVRSSDLRPSCISWMRPCLKLHRFSLRPDFEDRRPAFETIVRVIAHFIPTLESEDEKTKTTVLVEVLLHSKEIEAVAEAATRMDLAEVNRLTDRVAAVCTVFSSWPVLPPLILQLFSQHKQMPAHGNPAVGDRLNTAWEPLTKAASDLLLRLGFEKRRTEAFGLKATDVVKQLCSRECGVGVQFPEVRFGFTGEFWLKAVREAEHLPETADWNDVSLSAMYTFRDFLPDPKEALNDAIVRGRLPRELKNISGASGFHAWFRRLMNMTAEDALGMNGKNQQESKKEN